jgi:dienelactone hydrolase
MPHISILPPEASLDQTIVVTVAGLEPGAVVQLQLRNHSLEAEAAAEFRATQTGIVDTAADAPIGGDYDGVDPSGLFWAARFDQGADTATMIAALSTLKPISYTATAVVAGEAVATIDFARRLVAPDIVVTPVGEGHVRGTLFAQAGVTDAPGVIVLGGSDGGNLYTFVAALLASHGMVAMSLAFFDFDDLPKSMIEIPVEYFAEAIHWLRERGEVGRARVGALGFSRGAEAALLLASTVPDVAAVVALAPSSLTGGGISGSDFTAMAKPAWTLNGQPLPLLPPPRDPAAMKEVQEAFTTGKPLAARAGILRGLESAGSRVHDVAIPVERIHGGILMMSGEDDQLWPSTWFAQFAEERLAGAGFRYPYEHRRYRGAGHFGCLPPNLPATTTVARHPLVPMLFDFGGSPRENAAASADLWPRIVSFLRQQLAPIP